MLGARTLIEAFDTHARENPNRLYASVPLGSDIAKGFQDISFQNIAKSVNHIAALVIRIFGRGVGFETIAYIGIPDLRGAIVFLGAVKAGYKVNRHVTKYQHLFTCERSYCHHLVIHQERMCLSWSKPRASNYCLLLKWVQLSKQLKA